jgi:hypothetical protein
VGNKVAYLRQLSCKIEDENNQERHILEEGTQLYLRKKDFLLDERISESLGLMTNSLVILSETPPISICRQGQQGLESQLRSRKRYGESIGSFPLNFNPFSRSEPLAEL